MKKRVVLLVMVALLMFAVCACGKEEKEVEKDKQTDITIMLDWTPNTNHTGFYVAYIKGYFRSEGLNVYIQQPSEGNAEIAVATGQAQIGVSFQDTMASALTGDDALPITAIAALMEHNTSGILSRGDSGMEKPSGLEGRNYATWDNPIEVASVKHVVEKDGGEFDLVNMIPSTVQDEVSAIRSGVVDAVWVYYGWAGVKAKMEGLDFDYFAFADIDPVLDYYTPVVIANNQFLEENPNVTKAFLRALKRGYEYAKKQPVKAAQLLCKEAWLTEKEFIIESQKYISEQYKANDDKWGYIDAKRWNNYYKWINDNQILDEKVPLDTGFTNEYLPK